MSYNRNNRFGGGRGRSRGNYGGRDGGRNSSSGSQKQSNEPCRRYILGSCDFEQTNGRPCRFPHLVKVIGETRGHKDSIKDVVLWNARQQVFTCGADSCVKLWDCASWNEITTINFFEQQGHVIGSEASKKLQKNEGVCSLVLEGSILFAGFDGAFPHNRNVGVGMVRAWNLENYQQPPFEFYISENTRYAHTTSVLSLAVAMDPAGNATLFSGSADGSIKYWQIDLASNSFKCRGVLEGHVRGVTRLKTAIVGTTPILASASIDSTVRIWDLTSYQCVMVLSSEAGGHSDAVLDLEIWANQNETFLISGGLDREVIVWSLSPPFQQVFKETQSCQVTAICGAQDATSKPILLIGATDGSITVKELPSFTFKLLIPSGVSYGHQDAVRRILAGPHNTMFSVGNDRKMIAWQFTGDIAAIQTR